MYFILGTVLSISRIHFVSGVAVFCDDAQASKIPHSIEFFLKINHHYTVFADRRP